MIPYHCPAHARFTVRCSACQTQARRYDRALQALPRVRVAPRPPGQHGRLTALTLALSPAEQQTLETWQRSRILPAGLVRRAACVLSIARGVSVTATAQRAGLSRRYVYKWVARWQQSGFAGLRDLPRLGGGRRGK